MLTQRMQDELNKQINAEIYSSYLYLAMSVHFENKGLKGFANWMRIQAQEELTHAMKFYDFVLERGGKVTLTGVGAPENTWDTPLSVFEKSLAHEQHVTSLINHLMDVAIEEKDHATNSLLKWFIDEQVEEEATASEIVDKLKMMGSDGGALFMMNQELAQRVFVPPTVA